MVLLYLGLPAPPTLVNTIFTVLAPPDVSYFGFRKHIYGTTIKELSILQLDRLYNATGTGAEIKVILLANECS